MDPATAEIFANRTVAREGGEPGAVAILVPRSDAKGTGAITKPIDDMPTQRETIFPPGSSVSKRGDVMPLPGNFFD